MLWSLCWCDAFVQRPMARWQKLAATTANGDAGVRKVLVAGVLSLTGRSVAAALGKERTRFDVSALVSAETLAAMAADDNGRLLGADAAAFDVADGCDAVVIATDDAPDPDAVGRLVADAVAVGARQVVFYSRLGAAADGAAAALEALGDDRAEWRRCEDSCLRARGDASVTVLRTGRPVLGGPYYKFDLDTLRAQTSSVIDGERKVSLRPPSDDASQDGFAASRQPLARLAAVALDDATTTTKCVDATTGEGAATDDDALGAALAAVPARGDAPPPAPAAPASPADAADAPFTSALLDAFKVPAAPKQVNPFLAPPAVSGPYWFLLFGAAFQLWLASINWTWCDVTWAVDPESSFHKPFRPLEQLCEWDPNTRTAKRVDALAGGYFRKL